MVAEDAAICMRVQSSKEHTFANHAVGWYHWLKDPLPEFRPQPKRTAPTISVPDILTELDGNLSGPSLESLAKSLGVSYSALRLLEVRWSKRDNAWAFPMRGGNGEYTGIRLRNDKGDKWAVTGSKEGVFFAFGNPNDTDLWVVEGPTDTAAGMTIGLDVVGRANCYGGVDEIRIIVRNQKYKRVVAILDNDIKPEAVRNARLGMKNLLTGMPVAHCLLILPCKDLRRFVQSGGTRTQLYAMISSMLWTQPSNR